MTDQKSALPSTWAAVPLADVGVWRGGGTPSKAEPRFWNGSIPWISPKDMKAEVLHDAEDHISDAAVRESATQLVDAPSVLVVTRSGILRHTLPVAINAVPAALNQDLKAITPHPGIEARYIAWALRRFEQTVLGECTKAGTTVQSVETARLQNLVIPLAPLAEQRRIVAALEEHLSDLDAAVAGLERARANCARLRAACTRAAVDGSLLGAQDRAPRTEGPEPWTPAAPNGWEWSTVDQLAETIEYGTSTKTNDDATGVPVLRMGNIVDGRLAWDSLKYLPQRHSEFPGLLLRPGDVLFNRTNSPELVGKTAVYHAGNPRASFASYLLRVRLSPRMLPAFLSAYINSAYGRAWVASVVSQQVGQANVNGTKLRALPVPVPPVEEQHEIVAELDRRLAATDRIAADIDVQLARAKRLRQSILKRAFEGKLVPQEPTDEPASVLLDRIRKERIGAPAPRRAGRRAAASR